jgi:hypothetical protein
MAAQDDDGPDIRETLFGDVALADWPPAGAAGVASVEPWKSFVVARRFAEAGDSAEAAKIWYGIALRQGLEPRHALQAWHFLRGSGAKVPEQLGKVLLGVVLEVAMPEGTDLLAAYADGSARYYNYSGAGVVWDRPDGSLDPLVGELLGSAQGILEKIGPWDKPRRPAPTGETVRLNLLAPSGLHFGEASFEALSQDPFSAPTINAATRLMQALVDKSRPA